MPAIVVDDPRFGEGLGMLFKGITAGSDPRRRAEAAALQARIDNTAAATRQTELENENKIRQRVAEDEAAAAIGNQLQPSKFSNLPATVTAPAPSPEFIGPMPDIANPARAGLDERLAAARAIAVHAIRRGGSAEDAAKAAYFSLGMGGIYGGGLPTDEQGARQAQTLIGGSIPDAGKALTLERANVLAREKEAQEASIKQMELNAAMERERLQQEQLLVRQREHPVVAGENTTVLMTPTQRKIMGLPEEGPIEVQRSAGKNEIVETPGRPTLYGPGANPNDPANKNGIFGGDAMQAQAINIMADVVRKSQDGTLGDDDLQRYAAAKSVAFPDKTEWRVVGGEQVQVPTTVAVPRELQLNMQGPSIPPEVLDRSVVDPNEPRIPLPPTGAVGAPVSAPGGGNEVGPGGVITPRRHPYTEAGAKGTEFTAQMMMGHAAISDLEDKGQLPGVIAGIASDLSGVFAGPYTRNLARTDAVKNYESAAISFLEPIIRQRSGAAVLASEYKNYHDQFIPFPGDPPELQAFKRRSRQAAVDVMRAVGEGVKPEVILAEVQKRVGRPGAAVAPQAANPALTPPVTRPDLSDVDAIVGIKR